MSTNDSRLATLTSPQLVLVLRTQEVPQPCLDAIEANNITGAAIFGRDDGPLHFMNEVFASGGFRLKHAVRVPDAFALCFALARLHFAELQKPERRRAASPVVAVPRRQKKQQEHVDATPPPCVAAPLPLAAPPSRPPVSNDGDDDGDEQPHQQHQQRSLLAPPPPRPPSPAAAAAAAAVAVAVDSLPQQAAGRVNNHEAKARADIKSSEQSEFQKLRNEQQHSFKAIKAQKPKPKPKQQQAQQSSKTENDETKARRDISKSEEAARTSLKSRKNKDKSVALEDELISKTAAKALANSRVCGECQERLPERSFSKKEWAAAAAAAVTTPHGDAGGTCAACVAKTQKETSKQRFEILLREKEEAQKNKQRSNAHDGPASAEAPVTAADADELRVCAACNERLPQSSFSEEEYAATAAEGGGGRCLACVAAIPNGFLNIGDTGFAASSVTMLLTCPEVQKALFRADQSSDITATVTRVNNNNKEDGDKETMMWAILVGYFRFMRGRTKSEGNMLENVRKHMLLTKIKVVLSNLIDGLFNDGRQHDAQEFLGMLLDSVPCIFMQVAPTEMLEQEKKKKAMEEHLLTMENARESNVKNNNNGDDDDDDEESGARRDRDADETDEKRLEHEKLFGVVRMTARGNRVATREDPQNPVRKLIHGYSQTVLTCPRCESTCTQADEWSMLQLPMDAKATKETETTVDELIHRMQNPDDVEEYKCEACDTRGSMRQRNVFIALPDVLLVQMKRFNWVKVPKPATPPMMSQAWGGLFGNKINNNNSNNNSASAITSSVVEQEFTFEARKAENLVHLVDDHENLTMKLYESVPLNQLDDRKACGLPIGYNCTYRLMAGVVHKDPAAAAAAATATEASQSTSDSGHYISFARPPFGSPFDDGVEPEGVAIADVNWTIFNDDRVSPNCSTKSILQGGVSAASTYLARYALVHREDVYCEADRRGSGVF